MGTSLRTFVAIIAGMLAAFALAVVLELFSAVVHPLPTDFDGSMEAMCQHVARYPNWVLAVAVLAWGVAAFVGTWIANKIGNRVSAIVVGLLLLAAVVFNISMLPYPVWFKVACLLLIPTALVLGSLLASRRKTPSTNEAK